MFGAISSAVTSKSGSSGSFPYELTERVVEKGALWEIIEGTKTDDKSPVTIFRCDLTAAGKNSSVAKAAVQSLRRMRHPNILMYLADAEVNGKLLLVVEPVTLISSDSHNVGSILWGLQSVAKALSFLNNNCNLVHGNVGQHSVFVDRSGDWKLGGFELACDVSSVQSAPRSAVPAVAEFPPEVAQSQWSAISSCHVHAIDAFMFGKFAEAVLKGKVSPVRVHSLFVTGVFLPCTRQYIGCFK